MSSTLKTYFNNPSTIILNFLKYNLFTKIILNNSLIVCSIIFVRIIQNV
ncbi:MAG: hypothetical protein CH6_1729 [Candidatus Kapaibacterium sp.]|nr:MAG: hypothetical protein CH6_1729 [Candidatus Kapabacteria bacterium]